jgi:hypothetical protein
MSSPVCNNIDQELLIDWSSFDQFRGNWNMAFLHGSKIILS